MSRSAVVRVLSGRSYSSFRMLSLMGSNLGVNLDWLILGRGGRAAPRGISVWDPAQGETTAAMDWWPLTDDQGDHVTVAVAWQRNGGRSIIALVDRKQRAVEAEALVVVACGGHAWIGTTDSGGRLSTLIAYAGQMPLKRKLDVLGRLVGLRATAVA